MHCVVGSLILPHSVDNRSTHVINFFRYPTTKKLTRALYLQRILGGKKLTIIGTEDELRKTS